VLFSLVPAFIKNYRSLALHNNIYLFASHISGSHIEGEALNARSNYDAETGIAVGLTGDAYGIPTQGVTNNAIAKYFEQFQAYAWYVYAVEFDHETNKPLIQKTTMFHVSEGVYEALKKINYKFEDIPANVSFPETQKLIAIN
jgi:hypothetical protein